MTVPSAEKYRELIAALREAKAALPKKPTETDEDARGRQLSAGLSALQAVMSYLMADTDVLDGRLTQPLAAVEAAAFDAAQGAKPVLLNPPPPLLDGDRTRKGKAPLTAREQVQGVLAFAAALRMQETATTHTGAAANWVAKQAAKYGMTCENGAPIAQQQVKNWWEQVQRGSPKGAAETFDGLKERHAELLRPPRTKEKREECGARAVGAIKACAATNPYSAPSPTGRLKTKSSAP